MNSDTIRVGLIGMGTVGSGVVRILSTEKELIFRRLGAYLQIIQIADTNVERHHAEGIPQACFTTDAHQLLSNPEVDIVIELIGGITPAREFILDAITGGKPVVTANKALLAVHGEEIFGAACKQGVEIGFEASVGGGIPIIRILKEGFSAERILAVYGIVNGTSNYILTKMSEAALSFPDALKEAQALGYAEADPTLDISGGDAAHKLALLTSLAYGTPVPVNKIYTEGIDRITPLDIAFADTLGYKVKLLAITKIFGDSLEARVHPTLIPKEELLAKVDGVFNAICVIGESVGTSLFYGRGAGALPTGSAVVSDLIDIARNIRARSRVRTPPLAYLPETRAPLPLQPIDDISCSYYLRFCVEDCPGVLSEISGVLGQHHISIASVIQQGRASGGHSMQKGVSLVMMTHQAREKDIQAALATINQSPFVFDQTLLIRVESKID